MKIKNTKHLSEEQLDIIKTIIHEAEKLVEQAKQTYFDPKIDVSEKARMLTYIETQVATLTNLVSNTFGFEAREDDGMPYTQTLFNRVFGYCSMARVEKKKADEKNDNGISI